MTTEKRVLPSFTTKHNSAITASPHSIETTGTCSVCGQAMQQVTANKIPAYVCMQDRVVLPRPEAAINTVKFTG